MNDERRIDTSDWPETANLATWGRLLGLSNVTMGHYRKRGKLPGKRLMSGVLVIKRETVIKAFNIVDESKAAAGTGK